MLNMSFHVSPISRVCPSFLKDPSSLIHLSHRKAFQAGGGPFELDRSPRDRRPSLLGSDRGRGTGEGFGALGTILKEN